MPWLGLGRGLCPEDRKQTSDPDSEQWPGTGLGHGQSPCHAQFSPAKDQDRTGRTKSGDDTMEQDLVECDRPVVRQVKPAISRKRARGPNDGGSRRGIDQSPVVEGRGGGGDAAIERTVVVLPEQASAAKINP